MHVEDPQRYNLVLNLAPTNARMINGTLGRFNSIVFVQVPVLEACRRIISCCTVEMLAADTHQAQFNPTCTCGASGDVPRNPATRCNSSG